MIAAALNQLQEGVKRYFETQARIGTQTGVRAAPNDSLTGVWLGMSGELAGNQAQNIYEDIEGIRILLQKSGRPLPALPENFYIDTLLQSFAAHNEALTALQSILEVMDDDPSARALMDEVWQYHKQATKRDATLTS